MTGSSRHALVFGASGQIGRRVCANLLREGWRIGAVSRGEHADAPGIHWIKGDLQRVDGLPTQADAIFSCGPLDSFARWHADNAHISARVIAFGSTSIEVKRDSSDANERDLAARLHAAEALLFATAAVHGAQATVLRPTLVYGAGQDMTLSRIAALARRAGFFVLPHGADGLRQPVQVQELADAALAALDAHASHGRSYALPGGETLRYVEMIKRTLSALQPPARLIQVPASLFNVALSTAHLLGTLQGLGDAAVARMRDDLVFDVEPARSDFGYSPQAFNPTAEMFK